MKKTLVFTGGHHTSSLAVALELQQRGWDVIWFGHKYSILHDRSVSAEYKEVTEAGIKFIDLKAGKLYRTLNPEKILRLPLGFLQAFFILLKLKLNSDCCLAGIVSFGGYLAVPVVISGWLMGIQSVTHEQTVRIGWQTG